MERNSELFKWRKGVKGSDKGQIKAKMETRKAIIKAFVSGDYEQPSVSGIAENVELGRVIESMKDIEFKQSEKERDEGRKRRRVGRQIKVMKESGIIRDKKTIIKGKEYKIGMEFGAKLKDLNGNPIPIDIGRFHPEKWQFNDKLLGKNDKKSNVQLLREERINLMSKALKEKLSGKEQKRLR